MAVTRSVTRRKNQEECRRKRTKALEDEDSTPWLSLTEDILLLIILRLGVVDFVSFSGVCTLWRSIALSNKSMFMATRQPMSLSFSTELYKKYCHLKDFDKRKFKTNLPHLMGRTCVGVTCGYLILFGTTAYDFWLVNLITRHELHFPRSPYRFLADPENLRGILVFSPSMSGWVFVVAQRLSKTVSFCLAGNEDRWDHVSFNFPIHDLHFFQGKIYMLNTGNRLYEVKLNPKPTLKLLGVHILNSDLLLPEFASWGEKLYVMGDISKDVYGAIEVDFDQLKRARPIKTIDKHACLESVSRFDGDGKVGLWANPHEQYEKYGYFHGYDEVNRKGGCFDADSWYFPHECLNVNALQE